MKKKSIAFNAILNTIQTIVSIIFPLITYPYCSRVLGVDGMGKYGFSYSIVSYFILIAGLGIGNYAIREGARLRENKGKLEKFISEIFSINLYTSLIAYLLFFIIIFLSRKMQRYSLYLIILSTQIIFITFGKDYLYTIYEDYVKLTYRRIISQILSLILMFLFVKNPNDLAIYCCISIFSIVLTNIINYFDEKRFLEIRFVCKPSKKHLKPILLIFSTTVGITIYASSDTTILGLFGSDFHVGIYNTSVKIYSAVKQAIAAVLIVSIPRFSYYLGIDDKNSYNELFSKIFNILVYLILPSIAGIIILSKQIVTLIAGKNYISAYSSLSILSIAMFFNLIEYMYGYCVLLPNRRDKEFMIATSISAVVNIGLNIVLIPIFYENAAAATTVIAELIVFIMALYYSKDLVINKVKIRDFCSILFSTLAVSILVIIIKRYIRNDLVTILVSVPISVLLYVILTYLLKNSAIREIKLLILGKLNN